MGSQRLCIAKTKAKTSEASNHDEAIIDPSWPTPRTSVILPMREPYMQQIVSGEKNYEFRKYNLRESIEWVWFYRTAPHSSIEYICRILPAQTRGPGQTPLDEDGLGNREFNEFHKDWEGYDFAYKVVSVYHLKEPITLEDLRRRYDFKSAPRSRVYDVSNMVNDVKLSEKAILIWDSETRNDGSP